MGQNHKCPATYPLLPLPGVGSKNLLPVFSSQDQPKPNLEFSQNSFLNCQTRCKSHNQCAARRVTHRRRGPVQSNREGREFVISAFWGWNLCREIRDLRHFCLAPHHPEHSPTGFDVTMGHITNARRKWPSGNCSFLFSSNVLWPKGYPS